MLFKLEIAKMLKNPVFTRLSGICG